AAIIQVQVFYAHVCAHTLSRELKIQNNKHQYDMRRLRSKALKEQVVGGRENSYPIDIIILEATQLVLQQSQQIVVCATDFWTLWHFLEKEDLAQRAQIHTWMHHLNHTERTWEDLAQRIALENLSYGVVVDLGEKAKTKGTTNNAGITKIKIIRKGLMTNLATMLIETMNNIR
ncbi:hypothetical protein ACJX0J_020179, partial [Zea mays]